MTTIEVRIDRVVLDGLDLPPGQAAALGEALRAELARLLAAAPPGTWRESRHSRRVGGPALPLDGPPAAPSLGEAIARCVGAGLRTGGGAR